jgi:hypothetical protein
LNSSLSWSTSPAFRRQMFSTRTARWQ